MIYTYYKQMGSRIFVRYKTQDGSKTKNKIVGNYEPTLYVKSEEETGISSIYGYPLKPVKFDSIRGAKQFGEQYKGVDNFIVEGNGDYSNQFMIDLYEGQTPDYDENGIRCGAIDIEVQSEGGFPEPDEALWPVTAITIHDSVEKKFYTFALKNDIGNSWDHGKSPEAVVNLNVEYFEFEKEENLLRSFCSHMQDTQYDLTTGWNSESFDMPYIVNRCFKILGEAYTTKMLSPFNKIEFREVKSNFGKPTTIVDIMGQPHLDYMQIYKKHTYTPRATYRLDFIANAELGERKLSYEEAGSLKQLYKTDFQLYIDYNIQDVNIIVRLEEKLGLLSLVYAMTYYTLSNFEDTMGTVKIWEKLVAKYLYNVGKAPLFRGAGRAGRDFEGAFVKEVVPGRYKWILSQDLNSLYPHIEMQWNIGPETRVSYDELPQELVNIKENHNFDDLLNDRIDLSPLKKYDVTMAANFEFYRRDQMSFFSAIKRDLYNNRKKVKREMLDFESQAQKVDKAQKKILMDKAAKCNSMQMGLKILLNGGYGALANKYFLYYMVENAEAITLSGQLVNKYTAGNLSEQLKKMFDTKGIVWVAGDTDSMYLTIEPFMKTVNEPDIQKKVDIADRFCKEVVDPIIDDLSNHICDYVNGYEQKMKWEREVIAETAIWVAKKKYAMHVWDSEGVRFTGKPKMKLTGLESVKSSTPGWSQLVLEQCYDLALHDDMDGMYDLIDDLEEKFMKYDLNDIAIPSGINNIGKYVDDLNGFVKGTPKHVKAAITHNIMIEKLGLTDIEPIQDGNKIKWLELRMPNPTGNETVAFDTYLPPEFKVERYVDKSALYERSFKKPLRIFLESIGWEPERTNTLF